MAKDPAFLFYSQDFLVGTMAMPFDERGRYITLLCYIHQNGHISEETIRLLVGSFSDILRLKFLQDENGMFYNPRLEIEVEKRGKFMESRLLNGSKGGRPKKEETIRLLVGKPNGKPKKNLIENEDVIVNIIEYLNKKVSKSFKPETEDTQKVILARLKEGYLFEHFKKVIDVKSKKWISDPKMVDFLRPETLFGNKFEGYLNEYLPEANPSSDFLNAL